jgi:tetratricopeptide (TPR) repeat protein
VAGVPRWLRTRGQALESLARVDEALADYDAALAIDPDFRLALVERSAILAQRGEHAAAIADLSAALLLRPGDLAHRVAVAEIELARGRPAEALPHLEAVTRAQPERADALGALGLAYRQLGRLDESVTVVRRAVAEAPRDVKLKRALRDTLAERGASPER